MANFPFELKERIPSLKAMTEIYDKTKCDLREVQKVLRSFKSMHNLPKENDKNVYPNIHSEDQEMFEHERQESDPPSDCQEDPYPEYSSMVAVKSVLVPAINYSKKKKFFTCLQNTKVESRNRRMLGMLQGTLQKFIDEAQREKLEVSRRAEIEKKIDKVVKEERESSLRQKLREKEDKQIKLKCLKECIILLEQHEMWKRKVKNKFYFILTRSKPPIYFLPSKHSTKTMELLIKSKNEVLKTTERHEQLLIKEIADIKSSYISMCNSTQKEITVETPSTIYSTC